MSEIRRRLGDLSGILGLKTPEYSDDALLETISGSLNDLIARKVFTTSYTISGSSITPEPSLLDGLIIATWSVNDLLTGDFVSKVRSGGLGVRFRSGQDEISTVEAAKKVVTVQENARKEFRELVNIKMANITDSASRLQ